MTPGTKHLLGEAPVPQARGHLSDTLMEAECTHKIGLKANMAVHGCENVRARNANTRCLGAHCTV